MLAATWRLYRALLVLADAATVIVTYVVADILRCRLYMRAPWPEQFEALHNVVPVHFWLLAVLPVLWPAVLAWRGGYDPRWTSPGTHVQRVFTSAMTLLLLLAALVLVLQREIYPRAQFAFFGALLPATTLLVRGTSEWLSRRAGSAQPRHVLIVGTGRDAVRLRRILRSIRPGRPIVVGHLRLPGESREYGGDQTGAILGNVDELATLLDRYVIDEVLFAVSLDDLHRVLPFVAVCEEIGVTAALPANSGICRSTPSVVDLQGIPLVAFHPVRHLPEFLAVKRVMDVALSATLLLLLSPLMLACALAIRLTSPGPVVFRQQRSGLGGRPFTMLKFRTMFVGSEELRADLAHLNESDGPVFKMRRDPRVTPVGRWLRKFSLDELPQLWNVLRGDMSLVGPRPPLPAEVERYDRWQRRRLSMRPGLTCLWQVQGRHRLGFAEWMRLDLFYIDHWSLALDFRIVCKTAWTVLSGSGA